MINNHEIIFEEKIQEKQLTPKIMNEFDVAALLQVSGIKIWQWRKIQQCLKLFMDIPQVCVTEERLRAVGTSHGEINHGTYYYIDPENPSKVHEEV